MDELVDVVDENDNIIDKDYKSNCRKEKKYYRGIAIFVFEDEFSNNILIQQRSRCKKKNPLKYSFPAGGALSCESYLKAAKREFIEEQLYNIDSDNIVLNFEELFKIRKNLDDDCCYMTIFKLIYNQELSNNPLEVNNSFFMSIDAILDDMNNNPEKYTKTAILLLNEYKNKYMK